MADDSTPALPPSTVLANLVFAIGARWAAWDAARAEAREALRRWVGVVVVRIAPLRRALSPTERDNNFRTYRKLNKTHAVR
jgi:hypothetical protein